MFSLAIFLAAVGITTLELSEASAVGMALYADNGDSKIYAGLVVGVLAILVPTALIGNFIAVFPLFYVRIFSATFLLYFGLRLVRSARRSVRYQLRPTAGGMHQHGEEQVEKGAVATAFSVGMVEAFEAAIVIVALLPNGFLSTLEGVIAGAIVVLAASFALRSKVRRVKQANVKVAVSGLLLAFALFWYIESVFPLSDFYLLPFFVVFAIVVYYVSHRGLTRVQNPASA